MEKRLLFCVSIILTLCIPPVFAAVPGSINFQGRITDNSGQPLTDTTGLTFKLYDTLTGGTAKWVEVHNNVAVVNGMANVVLGSYTVLTPSLFDTETWIEIMVGNDVLTPRQQLTAFPYAIVAGNCEKLSGRTYDMFLSTTIVLSGDVSGTYNATVVADDSHNHTNLQKKIEYFYDEQTSDKTGLVAGWQTISDNTHGLDYLHIGTVKTGDIIWVAGTGRVSGGSPWALGVFIYSGAGTQKTWVTSATHSTGEGASVSYAYKFDSDTTDARVYLRAHCAANGGTSDYGTGGTLEKFTTLSAVLFRQ
ncbi:MAG: hypothetical protein WC955_01780 [Elusimicrobiota bacterium]